MDSRLQQLVDAGQSIWLDNIRRSMFASGELRALIRDGLRGMTSNPTIFEKAIGSGSDYDEQLQSLIGEEHDPNRVFEALAIDDIRDACDEFRGALRRDRRRRRLRQPRGLAAAGARHRGDDRGGQAAVGDGRPPERDDQDPGDAGVRPGDHGGDRGRHQHQRHVAVLDRAVRGGGQRLHRRDRAAASARASRSSGSRRSPASSSAASTPPSTNCSRAKLSKGEPRRRPHGEDRRRQPQADLPAFQAACSRASGSRRCARAGPAFSDRSGPARAPRTRAIPT